jgi:hypothetical protein
MRDPSPYAGQTVQLRPDALEIGGLAATIFDWYENTGQHITWHAALAAGDFRAQSYNMRHAMGGLPDDDEVLFARVDGSGRIIHVSEIVGYEPPVDPDPPAPAPAAVSASEVGQPCIGCLVPLAEGDLVAVVPVGPGANEAARVNALAGLAYEAVTYEMHWACRTGDESYQAAEV